MSLLMWIVAVLATMIVAFGGLLLLASLSGPGRALRGFAQTPVVRIEELTVLGTVQLDSRGANASTRSSFSIPARCVERNESNVSRKRAYVFAIRRLDHDAPP